MAERPEEISIINELERLLDRRPFMPFTIVIDSGNRYEVTGRHDVAIGRSVLVLLGPNSPSIHLRTNSISALEDPHPAANANQSN